MHHGFFSYDIRGQSTSPGERMEVRVELKPIKKRKRVYEHVIDQIKQAIETGRIRPGEKLPSERVLAEQLHVARTSIKEAVTVLESSGIIIVRPGVGMFLNDDSRSQIVFRLSQLIRPRTSDFADIIELRQAIEGDAAYYAAKRMTAEQQEKLTSVYERLIQSERLVETAIEEDYQFHFTIAEAANNPVLLEVMNVIAQKMITGLHESRIISVNDEQLNKEVLDEHMNIYNAIMTHEPENARRAMWEHHLRTKERYIQQTNNKGGHQR